MRRRLPALAVLLLLLGLVGCGASPPNVRHLSGKVTFKGQPVPSGQIAILPDGAKGNSGPGGFAEIKNGLYDTSKKGGAVPTGAVVVRIDGFDGVATPDAPVGQPLFLHYEAHLEIAPGQPTQDFDVPATAALKAPRGGGEPP
jgi:hypothetical protein